MMKRLYGVLVILVFVLLSPLEAAAQTVEYKKVSHFVFTDASGITVETTVVQIVNTSSKREGYVQKDYTYKGKQIASVCLYSSFTYNGNTATAHNATSTHTVASGWTYSGEQVWCSGSTAYVTAMLTNGVSTTPVSLSLTCDANGNLS